jgi:hypothetical protein
MVDDACAQSGLAPNVMAEIASLPYIRKAVEAGFAATVLSPGAVSEEVASRRLATSTIGSPSLLRTVVGETFDPACDDRQVPKSPSWRPT